jgi:nucleotide-binding universal stress UspA family protein
MNAPLILVPLDGSVDARAALPVAEAFAKVLGASLQIMHVSSRVPPTLSTLAERLGLEQAVLHAWSLDTRTGEPSREIISAATSLGAKLIVMCTHTVATSPTTLLGHTALDVLRAGPCPIVLVSPRQRLEGWQLRRILLPHDGSPTANAAVALAADLVTRSGAELLVFQVGGTGVRGPSERGSLTMPRYVDQPQHEWPIWTGELLERLGSCRPDGALPAHLHVSCGDPGSEIVRLAAERSADLIVLAWKGEWSGTHASTLKRVVGDAHCPLLVVRAPALATAVDGAKAGLA